MHFVSLYIDSAMRTSRTQIFTGTATDTASLVDSGNVGTLLVVRIAGHHLDGTGRTVACTVATLDTIRQGDTLSSIARRYGTTANDLAEYNNLANKDALKIGQKLKIPKK